MANPTVASDTYHALNFLRTCSGNSRLHQQLSKPKQQGGPMDQCIAICAAPICTFACPSLQLRCAAHGKISIDTHLPIYLLDVGSSRNCDQRLPRGSICTIRQDVDSSGRHSFLPGVCHSHHVHNMERHPADVLVFQKSVSLNRADYANAGLDGTLRILQWFLPVLPSIFIHFASFLSPLFDL